MCHYVSVCVSMCNPVGWSLSQMTSAQPGQRSPIIKHQGSTEHPAQSVHTRGLMDIHMTECSKNITLQYCHNTPQYGHYTTQYCHNTTQYCHDKQYSHNTTQYRHNTTHCCHNTQYRHNITVLHSTAKTQHSKVTQYGYNITHY